MKKTILTLMLSGLCVVPAAARAQQWEALPKHAPSPATNPQTDEKVELGKILFFDPRLSEHGTLSCNSCHNVMAGGEALRRYGTLPSFPLSSGMAVPPRWRTRPRAQSRTRSRWE